MRMRATLFVALLSAVPGGLWAHPQAPAADARQIELTALRESATRGNAASQYVLGLRYANGVGGVDRDPLEAFRWYRRSSVQGYVPAQFAVGVMYERGVGVAADAVEAVRWYLAAALQGHAEAQHNLALNYERGRGVVRNEVQARAWYERAAVQGVERSQIRVAQMYAEGRGGEVDPAAAEAWFRVAAEAGNAEAQAGLGILLAEAGRGVDEREAYFWLEVATRRDVLLDEIEPALDLVSSHLDPLMRDAARVRADTCALAAYHFCGDAVAPPCAPRDAHRVATIALEPDTYPDIERPAPLERIEPRFPDDAVAMLEASDTILVDVLVLANGRVGPVCVRQSLGLLLDGAVVEAVRRSMFAPATQNDGAIPVWISVEIALTIASER